ncbi:MAG: Autotransporter adhesin UpaG [Burkholderia lata]|uniref:Autotransporter adhesin UpaG n=2 Tax=Burkholderia lata (strain ATCC 17760 / DSM 23089 / LMG 22485 / NCIMB 9086 / R18194 / 383) TaxID=482957 RepID=A0A833PU78_BURL3|nr:MAG: Autotransporter adhesin UpaG [Burkholderia lata]
MNKTYRTIWSESSGAWVAVSELAGAAGKSSRSARKSQLALVLLAGAGLLSPYAANAQYTALGSGGVATGNGSLAIGGGVLYPDTANGANATAIGAGTSAAGIGAAALGGSSSAVADHSTAVGYGSTASALNAFAAGGGVATAANAAAIGYSVTASALNAVAMGNTATAAGGASLAVGQNVSAIQTLDTALGANSVANSGTGGQAALAIGVQSSATATAATAIGLQATASGLQSFAIGSFNAALGDLSVAIGNASNAEGYGAFAMGTGANALGEESIAFGANAIAYSTNSIALGQSQVWGANGIAAGTDNYVLGDNSGAFGNSNNLGTPRGDPGTANIPTGSYAIGNNNTVTANNAFVLGNGVTIPDGLDGAVALGNASTVAAPHPTSTGSINGMTYNYAGGDPTSVVSVGASGAERQITNVAAGQVTSTSTDAINGSQLYATNQSISAANSAGLNFTDAAGNVVHENLGGTLPIIGATTAVAGMALDSTVPTAGTYSAKNVQTVADPTTGKVQVQIADNPNFTSVTTGDTVMNITGVTVNGGANGPVSLTGAGLNNGGNTITNVAAGVSGTDAVNVNQLNTVSAAANAGWDVSAQGANATNVGPNSTTGTKVDLNNTDGNIVVSKTATSNDVTFNLSNDVNVANSVTVGGPGGTSVTSSGVTTGGGTGPSLTTSGINAANTTITNVAPGAVNSTSTDGVNGSQLYQVQLQIPGQWVGGGNTTYQMGNPANGPVTITNVAAGKNPTDAVNVSQLTNVQNSISDQGLNFTDAAGNVVHENLGGTLPIIGATTAVAGVTLDTSTPTSGSYSARNVQSVADPVTGKVQLQIADNPVFSSVTTGNTLLNGNGLTITGGPSVTLMGIDAGGMTITGVAPGVNGTDAVNVNQLTALQSKVDSLGSTVATDIGGGSTYNTSTGAVSAPVNNTNTPAQAPSDKWVTGNPTTYVPPVASGTNSTAVGSGAVSSGSNSVAIGNNSNDGGRSNVVSVGAPGAERQISNVAAGTQLTDAVNVGQLNNAMSQTQQQFTQLGNVVDGYHKDAMAGTAAAMAMANLPQAYLPGRSMASAAVATTGGQSSVAVGVSSLSDNGKWVIKVSGSGNTRGQFGVAAGAGFHW